MLLFFFCCRRCSCNIKYIVHSSGAKPHSCRSLWQINCQFCFFANYFKSKLISDQSVCVCVCLVSFYFFAIFIVYVHKMLISAPSICCNFVTNMTWATSNTSHILRHKMSNYTLITFNLFVPLSGIVFVLWNECLLFFLLLFSLYSYLCSCCWAAPHQTCYIKSGNVSSKQSLLSVSMSSMSLVAFVSMKSQLMDAEFRPLPLIPSSPRINTMMSVRAVI